MARTIQSPGVEINEVDLSLRPALPAGTNILIPGFSPTGPLDEVIQMSSMSEFEQVYGLPTNAAERYFYHTARACFQSPANIYVSRLSYGADSGDNVVENKYSALLYPVQALSGTTKTDYLKPMDGDGKLLVDQYRIGKPEHFELTETQYQKIADGEMTWDNTSAENFDDTSLLTTDDKIKRAGIIVLNDRGLTINEKFEGYYVNLSVGASYGPGSAFDCITKVNSINKNGAGRSIPSNRLSFSLSGTAETEADYTQGTISEVVENLPSYDISTPDNGDLIVASVFKLRKSTLNPDTEKLDFVLTEYHVGSMNANRTQYDPNGGGEISMSLTDVTTGSPNIKVLVNDNIKNSGDWVDRDTESDLPVAVRIRTTIDSPAKQLVAHGVYNEVTGTSNTVGAVPKKLDRVFELIDNHELFPLDVTLEAGLGTIYASTNGGSDTANFDDEKQLDISALQTSTAPAQMPDVAVHYLSVANKFVEFAERKRKDHMCVLDPIRQIFVQGVNNTTLSNKQHNFSQHVYYPLKHIYSKINSSYAATYANWAKVYDGQLNRNIWVPMSGFLGAMYANTDANFQPWIAPAGFTRGVLVGVNDLALYPKQKHRDQLYKINLNPIANFPNDGFVVFGQKTMQAKPSAFDRINVRRLFLYLEKATRATVKYFVFEPNTLFTRTQVGNVLAPIFDRAKNTQGMYDYLLICDERNNTPDVIDQNEMVIDIYIKPVRAAEFILVNFYATRTGQDFSELVS